MKLVDYLTIAGLILGPVLSVLISLYFERVRQSRVAKEQTLRMFLRTKDLADTEEFSIAIKSIPIDFRRNQAVRFAYEDYLSNISSKITPDSLPAVLAIRSEKLTALVTEMLIALNYSRVEARQIARSKYISQGFVNVKQLQTKVMDAIVSISNSAKILSDHFSKDQD